MLEDVFLICWQCYFSNNKLTHVSASSLLADEILEGKRKVTYPLSSMGQVTSTDKAKAGTGSYHRKAETL